MEIVAAKLRSTLRGCVFYKRTLTIPAVLALATDNGGSSEASAKTAGKITASPSRFQAGC